MRSRDFIHHCELCPRRCGIDRSADERGFCKAGHSVEIFGSGPHHGEEIPISGKTGSGTIFFSRCTLACVYCQNYPWSRGGQGRHYRIQELAALFRELSDQGCHNWNLVSPTPWLPMIREALNVLRKDSVRLPVVYNTSGFERVETLMEYSDWIDIFLPDLRYAREETARQASDCSGYVKTAREALQEMWRQAGPLRLNADGVAVAGTICRLLILPGHAHEAVENLQWMAETIGTEISVSIMAQYLPTRLTAGREPWNRRITEAEYTTVCREAETLGFSRGWIQEFDKHAPKELIGFEMTPNS